MCPRDSLMPARRRAVLVSWLSCSTGEPDRFGEPRQMIIRVKAGQLNSAHWLCSKALRASRPPMLWPIMINS
ncbi:MAG: hypothetical protein ACD_10C00339G0001 [uncultured bacterium]|nr:MAG: hypothetical protein ACD_10C00339G0001 [uncultured bacterium]